MSILLEKTIKPSKLQPQIFALAKSFSQNKEEDYTAVVSGNNDVLCVIVTPTLFARYQQLNNLINQTVEEIEDEEDGLRLAKILQQSKKSRLIKAQDVFKKAGL